LADWEIENFITPVKGTAHVDTGALVGHIESVLNEEGFSVFPAVRVRITRPPLLLVISPKDQILYLDRIMLSPDLNDEQIEAVEKQVDELGLSSLATEIGASFGHDETGECSNGRVGTSVPCLQAAWMLVFPRLHRLQPVP
jgi:hypothetical protein